MQQFFEYSKEVATAKEHNRPIIAFESTLITQGLPYPHNLEIALEVEKIAREHDVTPATIAIMNGKIKIGLTREELDTLIADKNSVKASQRDLPFILSQKLNAGTTVAATLYCAAAAGIKVFATGGIGGVHRGDDYDISADLVELARTSMAVICSGAKNILDIPRTLELMETLSIPVVGYRTETFPAFYTADSTHRLSTCINDLTDLVKLLNTHWQLGFSSSVLINNPIPAQDSIPAEIIEPLIADALLHAEQEKITGKAITPFLLDAIAKATKGKSLTPNLSLIRHNAILGAELARALAA